jgi:hypothetical protein
MHEGELAGIVELEPGMRFPEVVIVGCASFRNCPRSMKVSTMSCGTLR